MRPKLYTAPYLLPFLLLLTALGISSCEKGNGIMATRTFDIQNFNKLNVIRHADVYITQGSPHSVTIEAEENLMDLINTDVVDGEWKVEFNKTVKEYLTMTIYITMPDVQSLRLTEGSGGDIYLENEINADNLILELSGDGSINGSVNVSETLTTRLDGSGNIEVSGTAQRLEAHNSGSGVLNAWGLAANTGVANLTGSGNTQVRYSGEWSAVLTGSGNIRYKGIAPVSTDVTGSGQVVMVP